MKLAGSLALLLTAGTLVSGPAIAGDDEVTRPMPDAKAKRERLLEVYRTEAAGYTIHRDASGKEKVELRNDPVYVWTNPVRFGQDGAVFVWTCRGRAEVIGTIFSTPAIGPKVITHEFHSLATTVLDVTHEGEPEERQWKPSAPGITLLPIADAPAPAPSSARRLTQMRALTNEFTARSEDKQGQSWDLRLLPQPLYRYQSTDPEVLDGAVFSFVTSAGTDPEILLIIEARRERKGPAIRGSMAWLGSPTSTSGYGIKVSRSLPPWPFAIICRTRIRRIGTDASRTGRFPPSRSNPLDRRPRAETQP